MYTYVFVLEIQVTGTYTSPLALPCHSHVGTYVGWLKTCLLLKGCFVSLQTSAAYIAPCRSVSNRNLSSLDKPKQWQYKHVQRAALSQTCWPLGCRGSAVRVVPSLRSSEAAEAQPVGTTTKFHVQLSCHSELLRCHPRIIKYLPQYKYM